MQLCDEDSRSFLTKVISTSKSKKELYDSIVNGPFRTVAQVELGLGTVVLLRDNKKRGYIERVALSATPSSAGAVSASAKPFNEITIPRDFQTSAHVRALLTGEPVVVTDWYEMFTPALTSEEARDNQTAAGISTSVVQPFYGKKTDGTIIFSLFEDSSNITKEHFDFFKWYSELIASKL